MYPFWLDIVRFATVRRDSLGLPRQPYPRSEKSDTLYILDHFTDLGTMNLSDDDIRRHLEALRLEHRDLDDVIVRLDAETVANQLQVQRLKKRKLVLKDEIVRLEAQMYPDIIA